MLKTAQVNAVEVEIIRCGFLQAAEDMNSALIRSAYTPTIYESKDCAVALLDVSHNVLGQSAGLPIFLGNLEEVTRHTEERFGPEVWQPGDIWMLNDAYISGAHLNDVTVYGPIFDETGAELLGFAASRAHWEDLGSKDPGATMDATTIYQEGLRFGATKVIEAGIPIEPVLDMIRANTRFPVPVIGDFFAQVSCVLTGVSRVREIVNRWGIERVHLARDEYFRQTRELEEQMLLAIPDGTYSSVGYMDDDGVHAGEPIRIATTVEVRGGRISVDLSESDDQRSGPVNCGIAQAISACRVAYKSLVSPDLPLNGGSFHFLDVTVREGSVMGATVPAPVQYYYSQLGLIIDLIVKALADALPERVAAASYGDSMIVQSTGVNPISGREFFTQEATVGGWGAWDGQSGESALINSVNGSLKDVSIEILESLYPVRINRYSIRRGSGGNGQYRGGDGVVREYVYECDQLVSTWWERSLTPAWGLNGGEAGSPPRVTYNPGQVGERSLLKSNVFPVRAGDILLCETGGGGGYGKKEH